MSRPRKPQPKLRLTYQFKYKNEQGATVCGSCKTKIRASVHYCCDYCDIACCNRCLRWHRPGYVVPAVCVACSQDD